jgi:hypothetical protein
MSDETRARVAIIPPLLLCKREKSQKEDKTVTVSYSCLVIQGLAPLIRIVPEPGCAAAAVVAESWLRVDRSVNKELPAGDSVSGDYQSPAALSRII